MKIGWCQFATRKDRLETVAIRYADLNPEQAVVAWKRLTEKMLELSDPSAPCVPKFNDLLLAIVAASAGAKHQHPNENQNLQPKL